MKGRRMKAEGRRKGGRQKDEGRRYWSHAAHFCLLLSAFCLFLTGCATAPKPTMLDLKIVNGRIIDGTGAPWYRGDVGVRGDTIVSIGDLSKVSAATTIDAHDNVVSPGFIDLLGQSQGAVFADPHLEAKVPQGV